MERNYIIAGPEFGQLEGHYLIIIKVTSWREPVLLISILVSLSLRMTKGRWRSLRNATLTRW
jgi:hypothetical protein